MDSVSILQVTSCSIKLLWISLKLIRFAIYFKSATCRDTYGLPDLQSVQAGEDEARALCTSEYSDISPLRDGNVAYSSLEGRPSAHSFDHSIELQVSTMDNERVEK